MNRTRLATPARQPRFEGEHTMSLLGKTYYKVCCTRLGRATARAGVRMLRAAGLCRETKLPLDALDLPMPAVRQLMKLWQRIHWSSGDGMMPQDELLAIYSMCYQLDVPGTTVELGAWTGLTTSYLAAACRARGEGNVVAVDTFEGTKEGGTQYRALEKFGGSTERAFDDTIQRAGAQDSVEKLIGLTHEVVDQYDAGPIRFLLIDADHSYEGVARDFQLWHPLVAPGGLIVFHDMNMPGVQRFVEQVAANHQAVEMSPGRILPNVAAMTKIASSTAIAGRATAPQTAGTDEVPTLCHAAQAATLHEATRETSTPRT